MLLRFIEISDRMSRKKQRTKSSPLLQISSACTTKICSTHSQTTLQFNFHFGMESAGLQNLYELLYKIIRARAVYPPRCLLLFLPCPLSFPYLLISPLAIVSHHPHHLLDRSSQEQHQFRPTHSLFLSDLSYWQPCVWLAGTISRFSPSKIKVLK